YVPGVGLVREGQVRALPEPASVTRDGVTVVVEQVIANRERTALVYTVEGIPNDAVVTQPKTPRCDYAVSLRLPDGSALLATSVNGQTWGTGYQHRLTFAPLPDKVNEARLVIPCLNGTRPGGAPENWEIPLRFVPAPPDMTAFPVIEIPTATLAVGEGEGAPSATLEGGTRAAPTGAPAGIPTAAPAEPAMRLTLDRAVEMGDGYLLFATLHWEDSPFESVDIGDPVDSVRLLDASGAEMLYEVRDEEGTGVNWDQRQTVFAIQTAPVQSPGPLTLVLRSAAVQLPADARFTFDPSMGEGTPSATLEGGTRAAPTAGAPMSDAAVGTEAVTGAGKEWEPNLEVAVGERRLVVNTVWASENGYEFAMTSDTGIISASCADDAHPVVSGYESADGKLGENTYAFGCGLNYADGLPAVPVTISIHSIIVEHGQPMQVQWTPPAVSATRLPTPAGACLTVETWQAALANRAAALPEGLGGRVITYGPAKADNPNGAWEVAIMALDGSTRQVIAGAGEGSFSPDGAKLAYSKQDEGIWIMDLATGEAAQVPGTGRGDFNPVWSPDGQQMVFNRGMGLYELFLIHPDGSGLRQLTFGGVQEWPVGWLEDGSFLYSVPGRVYESTVYRLDLATGESTVYSNENIASFSPDGRYMALEKIAFGERWQVEISERDGANRWDLASGNLWVLNPLWSPDGQWLLAAVSATDSGSTAGALVNVRTCEIIALPHIRGNLYDWAP
ncbi:MAG: hypothetical protein QUT27_07445, partial [candidate division Zixibacteria bacterium]|nr:hypothetical protein [candidate division Zixibacteria bacterium]